MTCARIGTISVDQFIAAAPAEVWRALTEPELHARWRAPGDVAEQAGHEFHLQRSRSNASCARSTRTGS